MIDLGVKIRGVKDYAITYQKFRNVTEIAALENEIVKSSSSKEDAQKVVQRAKRMSVTMVKNAMSVAAAGDGNNKITPVES